MSRRPPGCQVPGVKRQRCQFRWCIFIFLVLYIGLFIVLILGVTRRRKDQDVDIRADAVQVAAGVQAVLGNPAAANAQATLVTDSLLVLGST